MLTFLNKKSNKKHCIYSTGNFQFLGVISIQLGKKTHRLSNAVFHRDFQTPRSELKTRRRFPRDIQTPRRCVKIKKLTAPPRLNTVLGVWKTDETLSLIFDISHETFPIFILPFSGYFLFVFFFFFTIQQT